MWFAGRGLQGEKEALRQPISIGQRRARKFERTYILFLVLKTSHRISKETETWSG